MPPRKKKTATTVSPLAKPETAKTEAPAQEKPQKAAPKAAKPSAASLARRKRALIDELRAESTSVERSAELHTIINTELADVPILSHQELSRLGA